MEETPSRWRFVRVPTPEGDKYFWELIRQDGTVADRIEADITVPKSIRKPTLKDNDKSRSGSDDA